MLNAEKAGVTALTCVKAVKRMVRIAVLDARENMMGDCCVG